MASLLQVKRSNTDTDGSGLSVASGELAYSTRAVTCVAAMSTTTNLTGGGLWIGDNNGHKRLVGGDAFTRLLTHAAGTTTAGSALVVNSSKAVDTIGSTNFFTSHQNTGCLTIKANQGNAFKIYDNAGTAVEYMDIDTTTSAQCITFTQPTVFSGGVSNSGDITVTKNDPTLCLVNNTAENTDGGADSSIQFIDHSGAVLSKICTSHTGTGDDTKGEVGIFTNTGSALTEAIQISEAQGTTFCGNISALCDLTITGDLTVQGDTVTLNTATLEVEDKNIVVAKNNSSTAGADGAGVTIEAGTTDITWKYEHDNTAWESSEHIDIVSGEVLKIGGTQVLSGSALGSGITSAIGLTQLGNDLCTLDSGNNADPHYKLGATAACDHLIVTADTDASSHLINVTFDTPTQGTFGKYGFSIDGTEEAALTAAGFCITAGDYKIGAASVLNATTLGGAVTDSSLTSVGALDGGSITANFGNIDNGTSNITTGGKLKIDVHGTAKDAVGALTLGSGAQAGMWVHQEEISSTNYQNLMIDNAAGRIGVCACSVELLDNGNDHSPYLQTGATRLCNYVKMQSVYDSSAATLNYALFETKSGNSAADKGKFVFAVDGTAKAGIEDGTITGCTASCGMKLENFTIDGGTFS